MKAAFMVAEVMVKPTRPVLTDAAVLVSLAHPVRLDVLNYLMSDGPATGARLRPHPDLYHVI